MALLINIAKDPFGVARPEAYARLTAVEVNLEREPAWVAVTISVYPDKATSDAAKTDASIMALEHRRTGLSADLAVALADGGRAAAYAAVKSLAAYQGAVDA